MLRFTIRSTDEQGSARTGSLNTDHGTVHTPIFMPVGTQGAVKGVHFRELVEEAGTEMLLSNTYHLFLRPGLDVIRHAGGFHGFTGWRGPVLTDSGGYQVYSLSSVRRIEEEGVHFRSHLDGQPHFFTPESAIDLQRSIGADLIMAFDECTPYPCERRYAASSMELTHRWLDRCMERFRESGPLYGYDQALFPIVQGSVYPDLRKRSAEKVAEKGAEGNAIGGLSVGEPHEQMYEMTAICCDILPADRPRYLMGVGTPANILEAIDLGVDMFDCVMPTRNGRNGMLFTWEGVVNIRNQKWKFDQTPLDSNGAASVDHAYSRSFLRHLMTSKEMLGAQIASIHNLAFYESLMRKARERIEAGQFRTWKEKVLPDLARRL